MDELVLPDQVFSTEHLTIVLNDIDRYLKKLQSKKEMEIHFNRLTILTFESNGVTKIDSQNLNLLKTQITKIMREAPRLDIRTAHPIIDHMQMRINDWVKHNISKKVLLSFQDDYTLLAGVLIQTPTKRLDYTLRRGLDAGHEYLAGEVRG